VIKLPYRSLDEFALKFKANLSDGGMFVRTNQPKPRGTELDFKIELADGAVALHGKAISRWVRLQPDEVGPAGMGVEFLHLEPEGRALVNRMLGRGAPAVTAEELFSGNFLDQPDGATFTDPEVFELLNAKK
jgi:uncharacterized protein (TIGR02266 family)